MQVASQYVRFTATSDQLTLTSLNTPQDEVGHVRQESTFKAVVSTASGTEVKDKDVVVQEGSSAAPICVQGTFLLKYLTYFTRHLSLSDTTKVFLRSSFPLCLDYSVSNVGYLRRVGSLLFFRITCRSHTNPSRFLISPAANFPAQS